MAHTSLINSATIREYASTNDRIDHFDDTREIHAFTAFLQHKYDPKTYHVVMKPEGPYGVDIGLFTTDGVLVCGFDLERCLSWDTDWPSYWRSLSFLERKKRYLDLPQFGMVWFNKSMTKCVVAWKEDILTAPVKTRTFAGRSYTDRVRLVPFSAGRLIGHQFAPRELKLFSRQIHFDFSAHV